jgi:electron transfer flavoprotein alpha subunit
VRVCAYAGVTYPDGKRWLAYAHTRIRAYAVKIAVCIKQVPVVADLQFDRESKSLRREGVRMEVSPFDLRALYKAVQLKEAHGAEVTVVTMGPPQAREALLEGLALGADRALHLCDRAFAGADTLATARALAAALRGRDFDLILCGRNSVDAETGQVGPELAELLDLPQVTHARRVEIDAGMLAAEREVDDAIETVSVALPAVVSAAEDLAPERFTTSAEREAAAQKPIEVIGVADLAGAADRYGIAGSPTWVLGLEETVVERRAELLEGGNAQQCVDDLVGRLLAHGLFGEWQIECAAPRPPAAPARVARRGAKDVLVVAETVGGRLRPVALELLGKARQLAAQLGGTAQVLVAGTAPAAHVGTLAAHGASRVLVAEGENVEGAVEPFADLLARVIRDAAPGVVLLGSTVFGRDLAPRVAARLELGLTGDCIDVSVDGEGRVLQHKPAFGGTAVALIASRTQPEMATVRPGMLAPAPWSSAARAEVVAVPVGEVTSRVRVASRQPIAAVGGELDQAAVVVGVGKGVGGPHNLPLIEALAAVLEAGICTTRDVADEGWLPKQLQVGITGRAIAPRLYVAVGVRGAFEHAVGFRRAGLVVAINKSRKAPIFKLCDYGLVGDFATVVPLLIGKLRAARPSTSS